MQAECSTSLIAPAVARDSVAVAQDLVESLLYRDWALVVQHDGVGGGLASTSVVVERCLRVGKDKHLANPETKLGCAGAVLGAVLQDSIDLVEETLRDERLGLFALRERRKVLFFDALVLFVRRKPSDITRAIRNSEGALSGRLELRSLDVEGIIRRIESRGHDSIARVQVQSTENAFQTSSGVRLSVIRGHRGQAADRPIVGCVCHSLSEKLETSDAKTRVAIVSVQCSPNQKCSRETNPSKASAVWWQKATRRTEGIHTKAAGEPFNHVYRTNYNFSFHRVRNTTARLFVLSIKIYRRAETFTTSAVGAIHSSPAVFLGRKHKEIDNARRIAPLIVVPRDKFDKVFVQLNAGLGIKDRRSLVSNKVSRHNIFIRVLEDALEIALRSLLDRVLDLIVRGFFLETYYEIND
jgi:hypothetical protein